MKILALIVVFAVLALTGCGGGKDAVPCMGTVSDKYTKYDPGVNINAGSGISIPTGRTRFVLVIKREDGTACTAKLREKDWITVKEGDSWPA